ncbi:response regulator [Solidesulfovibrio sp.]
MRVTGGYGGGSQPGGGGGKDRSDAQAFRRGRRRGQIVRGRLVSPGPGGFFWVVVAGHKLLAALDHEPAPGRELVFRIEGLEPDLVLRDITPPPSVADDPVLLLAALTDARSKFEAHLHRFAPSDTPSPGGFAGPWPGAAAGPAPQQAPGSSAGTAPCAAVEAAPGPISGTAAGPTLNLTLARARFQAFCLGDAAAGQALARVRELVRLAGLRIPPAQGRPFYAPWAFPGLGQSEGLAGRSGRHWSLRLFGRLAGGGRAAAVVTVDGTRVAYRLMLEDPAMADAVIASLARVLYGRCNLTPVCLSAGGLPGEAASGFWARILAGAARPFTGLRLRV